MKQVNPTPVDLKKVVRNILTLIIVIGIGATLMTSFTLVSANHVGVRVSAFGGVSSKTLPTGMHFKLPFGFETIYTLSTAVETRSNKNISTQTKDAQYLDTDVDVKYRISKKQAMNVFSDYRDMETVSNTVIQPAVQRAIESVTVNYDIYENLGSKRNDILIEIEKAISDRLAKSGIEFVSVTIEDSRAGDDIENPIKAEAVKQNEVNTAKQEQEKAKIEAETKKIQAKAEADAAVIKAQGQADANAKLSGSITDELIRMKEAEAREKHGWVEVQTTGEVITDTTP